MKFLICDDHQMSRKGLIEQLMHDFDETTFDEAYDGKEAIEKLQNTRYDLVILDIQLPGKKGVEVFAEIKSQWPETPVLMISGFTNEDKLTHLYELGVAGYLSKRVVYEELRLAVTTVLQGKRYFDTSINEAMLKKNSKNEFMNIYNALSKRKKEIALLLAQGYSQKDIATMCNISVGAVGSHKSVIMDAFGFTEDAQLTLFCIQNDLFDPKEIDLRKIKPFPKSK